MRRVRALCLAAVMTVAVFLLSPATSADACMNCPCLSIKKDGPCLLR